MESPITRPTPTRNSLIDTTPDLRRLTASDPRPSVQSHEPDVQVAGSHRYQVAGFAAAAATFSITGLNYRLGYVDTFGWAPSAVLGLLMTLYSFALTRGRREAFTGMQILLLILTLKGVLAFAVGYGGGPQGVAHWTQLGYIATALVTLRYLRTPAARAFFNQD